MVPGAVVVTGSCSEPDNTPAFPGLVHVKRKTRSKITGQIVTRARKESYAGERRAYFHILFCQGRWSLYELEDVPRTYHWQLSSLGTLPCRTHRKKVREESPPSACSASRVSQVTHLVSQIRTLRPKEFMQLICAGTVIPVVKTQCTPLLSSPKLNALWSTLPASLQEGALEQGEVLRRPGAPCQPSSQLCLVAGPTCRGLLSHTCISELPVFLRGFPQTCF